MPETGPTTPISSLWKVLKSRVHHGRVDRLYVFVQKAGRCPTVRPTPSSEIVNLCLSNSLQ